MILESLRLIFKKTANVKFHENLSKRPSCSMRTERRADMTKLIVAFRNFVNKAEIRITQSLLVIGGSTFVTFPRNVTPYRDSVNEARDRVTYQKLATRSRASFTLSRYGVTIRGNVTSVYPPYRGLLAVQGKTSLRHSDEHRHQFCSDHSFSDQR